MVENNLEIIKVEMNENNEPIVGGRELHRVLEIQTRYNDWFNRMCEYGFIENQDYHTIYQDKDGSVLENEYVSNLNKNQMSANGISVNHVFKLDMAKEISMLQRNDKGKEVRQYFIQVEKDFNSPEKVMARALKIANDQIEQLLNQTRTLQIELQENKPKVEYFDNLVERNLLTNFRDTAKELHIAPRKFINYLIDNEFVYRDKKKKLKPYQDKVERGLFELKEYVNPYNGHTDNQTLVTPKGRETFRLLVEGI